jgi:retron-type reverse transcriptase
VEAVKKVQCPLNGDRLPQAVDADWSGYFDTIPHPELMRSLARRISDGATLHLIKMWLEAPVAEKDEKTGHLVNSAYNRDNRVGTPQSSPLSPLLSNI